MACTKTPIDVLVIGGGPAGLSVAVAALERGASRVIVADQAGSLRRAGHGLELMPNMVRTLCALSPAVAPLVEKHLVPVETSGFRSALVEPDGSLLHALRRSPDEPIASVVWWEVQRVLLEALPHKVLLLDHQLQRLVYTEHDDDDDDDDGTVEAHFVFNRARETSSTDTDDIDDDADAKFALDPEQVHDEYFVKLKHCEQSFGQHAVTVACAARIVIGADGIHSITRQSIYKAISPKWTSFATPVFTSFYSVYIFVKTPVLTDDLVSYLRHTYMHGAPVCIMSRTKEDTETTPLRNLIFDRVSQNGMFFFIFTASINQIQFKQASKMELVDHAIQTALDAGVSSKIVTLCKHVVDTSHQDSIGVQPFSIVPASYPAPFHLLDEMDHCEYPEGFDQPWFHRRATLVGDAAHAGPNFMAQGGGMAVEDAYELVLRLAKHGLLCHGRGGRDETSVVNVFKQYREGRLERAGLHQRLLMNRFGAMHELQHMDRGALSRILWKYDPAQVAASIEQGD